MGKVIPFPTIDHRDDHKKEGGVTEIIFVEATRITTGLDVWTCDCGSYAFLLAKGGEIICDECEKTQDFRHFDPSVPPGAA